MVPEATVEQAMRKSMMYCPETLTALTALSDTRERKATSIMFTVECSANSSSIGSAS